MNLLKSQKLPFFEDQTRRLEISLIMFWIKKKFRKGFTHAVGQKIFCIVFGFFVSKLTETMISLYDFYF